MNVDPRERRHEQRVRDEIAHHIDELRAHLIASGMSAEDAHAEAERRFGDRQRIAAETPNTEPRTHAGPMSRVWRLGDTVRQDVVHAGRQLIRHPFASGLTLATLVVGVSATAIVYSVVDAVVLSPLPFEEPDALVHVAQTSPQGREYSTSEPNFVDFRERSRSFTEMAAMGWTSPILTGEGDPESIDGRRVSHTFFDILGTPFVLGRGFLPEEDVYGGDTEVALLSEGSWRRRFGSDPDIVGRVLRLDGVARRVVGVVASDRGWPGVEVFTPLAPNPDFWRDDQRIETIARLAPGVTLEAAREDMSSIAAQLSTEYPDSNDQWGAMVEPARDWLVGDRLTRLGALLVGSVALFLLMACASVSNLLLARASARVREMGVRAALGAGRGRIGAQLVAEGGLLAVIGAGLGLLAAWQGITAVQAFGPADIARLGDATLDGPVLAVSLLASMSTVLVAGVAPALLLTGSDVFQVLRSDRRSGASLGARLRSGLVVAQFALAVAVVSGAGLLTRSFVELQAVDLGFDPGGVVRFSVRLPDEQFDQIEREAHLERLGDELRTIPGVRVVGATTAHPFAQMRPSNFVARSDQEPDRQQDFQPVSWRAVTGDFFESAGIPLLAGRTFGPEDRRDRGQNRQNPPVIIDRALADLLFPGEDPVGRLITWFLPGGQQCEIVGVVATTRDERIDALPRPRVYRPFSFTAWDQPSILVRTEQDPEEIIPALRRAALSVDRDVPAIAPAAVRDDVRASVAWPRFSMQVLTVFGLIALILAALGIYGVTSLSVSQRRHEIGVRIALGAEPGGVHRMVVARAIRLAGAGIALGVVSAGLLTRFVESMLYEVSPTDPLTFLTVPGIMIVVAVVSTWLPARRAVRLDPREALVSE